MVIIAHGIIRNETIKRIMGIDLKYGRVTVEKIRNRPIGEDEPVVVFRAQDKYLPAVLNYYVKLCAAGDSPDEHLNLLHQTQNQVATWQEQHSTQTPGSDELPRD